MLFDIVASTANNVIRAHPPHLSYSAYKQACAAEIAVRYAALTCKQNKRYRTSARLTKTRDRCSNVNNHGTDGQTDRQSATQYAAPS